MLDYNPERTISLANRNDQFRRCLSFHHLLVTPKINELGRTRLARIMDQIRGYNSFKYRSDQDREHRSGAMFYGRQMIEWIIQYIDRESGQFIDYPEDLEASKIKRAMIISVSGELDS